MGLVRHLFGRSLASAAATAPTPTPELTPALTPEPASAPEPSAAPLYVLYDPGSGVAVDLSLQPAGRLAPHPAYHAAELLRALIHDPAFAGGWALEKVLRKIYTAICQGEGAPPLPWTVVLRHFNEHLRAIHGPAYKKTYKRVYEGGRLRRRRAYRISRLEDKTIANVG